MKGLIALLLAFGASSAMAQFQRPSTGLMDSMEWRVAQSTMVAIGTIESVEAPATPNRGVDFYRVTFKIDETLKGPKQKDVRFVVRSVYDTVKNLSIVEALAANKTRLMVFLTASRYLVSMNTHSRDIMKDTWAYASEAYAPLYGSEDSGFYELSSVRTIQSWNLEMEPLFRADDLIAAAKKAVAEEPKNTQIAFHCVIIRESGSSNNSGAFRDGALTVMVPIDKRLEKFAHRWLSSSLKEERLAAVRALVYFPSAENAKLLRPLLTDEGLWTDFRGENKHRVREAATMVLEAWRMPLL